MKKFILLFFGALFLSALLSSCVEEVVAENGCALEQISFSDSRDRGTIRTFCLSCKDTVYIFDVPAKEVLKFPTMK